MAAPSPPQQPPAPAVGGFSRWVPSLPTFTLNTLNPFASPEQNTDQTSQADEPNKPRRSIGKRPLLSPTPNSRNSVSPSRSNAASSVMFAEPDTRTNSEDGDSREGSIDERRKSKKSNKPKTRFSVCHAPPASLTRHKLHRRPRALLQLHKLSTVPGVRPHPAFEIVPSANFSVSLTRAVTKVFRTKHGLCPNDLLVLRAEDYSVTDADEDGEQAARDVIGLICKGRKEKEEGTAVPGKAKICLVSGQEWEASPLMNGGYEFYSTDEHGLGLTVRWVPKRNKEGSKAKDSKRFNFSTISPNSRRHPVIAHLSKTSLEINDVYKMPEASITPISTPKQGTSILTDAMEDEAGSGSGQDQCRTDDRLREVITMTAIWTTFKEGWSPSFKYDDVKETTLAKSPSIQNSPSKSIASPHSTPPGSPLMQPLEKRTSLMSISSGIMRKSSLLSKSNRASQVSVPEDDVLGDDLLPKRSNSGKKTGRARGDSTSTVLVHRAASNRRKNNQQAAWKPDFLSAEHQVNETSREDVRSAAPLQQAADVGDQDAEDDETEDEDVTPTPTPRKQSVTPSQQKPIAGTAVVAVASAGKTPEKRGSTATTETGSSAAAPPKSGSSGKTKKKRVWRRLLCGASMNDV